MEGISDLNELPAEPPKKRDLCNICKRPIVTCWCQFLERVEGVSTNVYILQHPYEESRNLKTAPMLYHGLPEGRCQIFKGRRFSFSRFPQLEKLSEDPHTLLLYPGPSACNIDDVKDKTKVNLIVLDGTWSQAKGIYLQTNWLQSLKQVKISSEALSEYVIRTQPTDGCLSTVETVAHAISVLENRPDVIPILVKPLKALCDFQIQHGALKHHSRQYLIENGLYKWQNPKKDPYYKADQNCDLEKCEKKPCGPNKNRQKEEIDIQCKNVNR